MAKVRLYLCLCCLPCLLGGLVASQNTYLQVKPIDASTAFVNDTLRVKTQFGNLLQCRQYIQQLPGQLQAQGFLAASIDSLKERKDTVCVSLFVGKKYIWESIAIQGKDKPLLAQLGLKEDWYKAKPVNAQQVSNLQNKLLDYCLKNGYPFAAIQFDSVALHDYWVDASLNIRKGIPYKLDSIRVLGTAKINNSFLYHYLNLTPGGLFNADKLNKINQLLKQLPYLQQSKDWDMTMLASSYLVNLYLQPKRSNQINVLVGFLPANQQNGGNLLFTGEATVNLKNPFGAGETIGLNWQQLQAASPRLNVIYQQPYLFNSPYGVDFSFDLYKKDSAYLNITSKIGMQYLALARQKGTVALQWFATNLLTVDTATVKATHRLPDIADMSNTSISIEYAADNTNYSLNPIKGDNYSILLSAGNKIIKKSNAVLQLKDTFDYSSLYDSVKLNTYSVRLKGVYEQYTQVGWQSVLKTAATAGWIESASYFRNELFQIGGYKLLRGFDEESIIANRFVVGTVEYRYLLGINSYFNGFADVGFTHNSITAINNNFIGAGIGLAFETKQGIVNISYAAGKRNDLPFNLRESKIHIGFVSVF
ncbi:BamA/TamA family outer membrane protein [Parasediminibacterium sp. JCM 36343]|uniref:BamA/TamA family outer membrane protein n=1 Tax=Parasediminibacterium sp. JCM 36343 TaxID=3374279 RepID=UPI00397CBE0C